MRIRGEVIHGDRRGRELGYPTANVALPADVLGAAEYGIYAGRCDGRPAAVSVGVRPTFGDGLVPLVEAFVLDFDGDLYGQEVTLDLDVLLRGERRFDSAEALVEQIERDVEQVRAFYAAGADEPVGRDA